MMPVERNRLNRRAFVSGGVKRFTILSLFPLAGLGSVTACHASPSVDQNDGNRADTDDTSLLQRKLDQRGTVYISRIYTIRSSLYVRGDTRIIGRNGGKIVWAGPPNQSIIRDTSTKDPRAVNRNITIDGFDIVGNGHSVGTKDQFAIEFYRTGNVTIRNLRVYGVGGSAIRWGNSHADTTDVLIEGCTVYRCRSGDAIQGSGRRIVVRNNRIGVAGESDNFGDTAIALLMDFEKPTNPESSFSSDVRIHDNIIFGDRRSQAAGKQPQTGIAIGPFDPSFKSNISIEGNQIADCHVGIWTVALSNLTVRNNRLLAHKARDTANVRLDSVSDFEMSGNIIYVDSRGAKEGFCAVSINAARSQFGASAFDGDVDKFDIFENDFYSIGKSQGIQISFGARYNQPVYVARISNGRIRQNSFHGNFIPVMLAPSTGETNSVFLNVSIENNQAKCSAVLVEMRGRRHQYDRVLVENNKIQASRAQITGTGISAD